MYNNNLEKMLEKYHIGTYSGCAEPGYDDKPVALANWNNIPGKVYNALEFMGYSCEWEDEWTMCGNCYKVIRTNPNSYGWQQYFSIIGECDLVCGNCIKEDPTEYLEQLENNPKNCMTIDIDLEENGYELMEDEFESGLHEGMNSNPTQILNNWIEKYPDGKFIFVLDEQSQFYIGFSIWKKKEEVE